MDQSTIIVDTVSVHAINPSSHAISSYPHHSPNDIIFGGNIHMLKTAICDDDDITRSYLASLIRKQPFPCEIAEYASADGCLADVRKADLYFLDIDLGPSGVHSDGMALAQRLKEQDSETEPVIIFVTGYEQYVFDAFDVGAFQYLLKPVDEQKFARVFARASVRIEKLKKYKRSLEMNRTLTLQLAGTSRTIPLSHIQYIESSNHKVILHLRDGELAYYAKISDLEAKLQGGFFRIHKGYLVNLAGIEAYSRTEATMTNGDRLQISKYKYQDFVKAYLRFLKMESGL